MLQAKNEQNKGQKREELQGAKEGINESNKVNDLSSDKTLVKIDNQLLWQIEEHLGEITDVQLTPYEDKFFKFKLTYKSNGIDKAEYFNSLKTIIIALHYLAELNSPIKRYKLGS